MGLLQVHQMDRYWLASSFLQVTVYKLHRPPRIYERFDLFFMFSFSFFVVLIRTNVHEHVMSTSVNEGHLKQVVSWK